MKSVFDLIKEQRRQAFADASPEFDSEYEAADEPEMPDAPGGFRMQLKKKRRTAMLRKMLADAGYGDLAKMMNIKEY